MRACMALLSGLLLAAGLCAGCGSATRTVSVGASGPAQSPATSPVGPLVGAQCPSGSTDPAITRLAAVTTASPSTVPLPADFTAVAAVRCGVEVETIADDGTWTVALGQRATGNLDALITALRLPSVSPPAGTQIACAAVAMVLPNFALVDAQGRIVRPSLPHDACDSPLPQAVDALNALAWKTETKQKLAQVQTQAEIDTGCPNAYKDVFELPAGASSTPWIAPDGAPTVKPAAACEYTVSPTGGSPIGLGEFGHGVKLGSTQQLAIASALTNAGSTPAAACTATASKFALLTVGASDIAVELDGCQRTVYPNLFVAQTPPSVLNALSAAGIF